jgi:hypothetical protein
MRRETISIYGLFTFYPSTKAVAMHIYQNVAHEFESAERWSGAWKHPAFATAVLPIQLRTYWKSGRRIGPRGCIGTGRARLCFSGARRSRGKGDGLPSRSPHLRAKPVGELSHETSAIPRH